jgi:hypothetical protein
LEIDLELSRINAEIAQEWGFPAYPTEQTGNNGVSAQNHDCDAEIVRLFFTKNTSELWLDVLNADKRQ